MNAAEKTRGILFGGNYFVQDGRDQSVMCCNSCLPLHKKLFENLVAKNESHLLAHEWQGLSNVCRINFKQAQNCFPIIWPQPTFVVFLLLLAS